MYIPQVCNVTVGGNLYQVLFLKSVMQAYVDHIIYHVILQQIMQSKILDFEFLDRELSRNLES